MVPTDESRAAKYAARQTSYEATPPMEITIVEEVPLTQWLEASMEQAEAETAAGTDGAQDSEGAATDDLMIDEEAEADSDIKMC